MITSKEITIQENIFKSVIQAGFSELSQIDSFVQSIIDSVKKGLIRKKEFIQFLNGLPTDYNDSIQSYALRKPYGYAGDFLVIDKIYTHHVAKDGMSKKWDLYFHKQAAPQAVRNRKEYFKSILKEKLSENKEFDLLNIASGPARDLKEVYDGLDYEVQLKSTCVDMDLNAIEYAKNLNSDHLNNIDFIHKNIFKFKTDKKFSLVWSAGLFDYFNDKAFVICLKKLKSFCKQGGEIVVGNFNEDHNPSRDYMEIFGDWNLIHRNENQLRELAKLAGFEDGKITIGKENKEVNLFLHLKVE